MVAEFCILDVVNANRLAMEDLLKRNASAHCLLVLHAMPSMKLQYHEPLSQLPRKAPLQKISLAEQFQYHPVCPLRD